MSRAKISSAVASTLVLVLGGCAAAPPPGAPAPPHRASVDPAAGIEAEVFDGVNAIRRASGLAALSWDADLASLARGHSEAMASGRVPFGHTGVDGRLRSALARSGTRRAAEIVSRQDRPVGEVARASIARWRASARHRANLLGAFSATGVGAARSAEGRFFVTQVFVE